MKKYAVEMLINESEEFAYSGQLLIISGTIAGFLGLGTVFGLLNSISTKMKIERQITFAKRTVLISAISQGFLFGIIIEIINGINSSFLFTIEFIAVFISTSLLGYSFYKIWQVEREEDDDIPKVIGNDFDKSATKYGKLKGLLPKNTKSSISKNTSTSSRTAFKP